MKSCDFIKISSLEKKYDNGFIALKDINVDIHKGEFLVIMGPSGCGKSTLLKMLAGFEEVKHGEIKIDNVVVNNFSNLKRDITMVFQSNALYTNLSSFSNIATPLYMKLLSSAQKIPLIGKFIGEYKKIQEDMKQKVLDVADILEIENLLNKKPSELSDGQRQRVIIGRAMVKKSKVFLMDEPLCNLDDKLRVRMRAKIAGFHKQLGSTFVYVTHDQTEAMTLGDRIAIMHKGEILQIDSPHKIYNDPKHLVVAEFIGSPKINIFKAMIDEDGFIVLFSKSMGIKCPHTVNENVTVAVRPEALKIANLEDNIKWKAKVYHKEYLGAYILLYIDVEESEKAVLRIEISKDFNPEINDEFYVKPKLKHLLVFDEFGNRMGCGKEEMEDK